MNKLKHIILIALALLVASCGGAGGAKPSQKTIAVIPKGVSIGLFNLLLISPFLAFLLAELFSLNPAMAVGLVLLGATPGGTSEVERCDALPRRAIVGIGGDASLEVGQLRCWLGAAARYERVVAA